MKKKNWQKLKTLTSIEFFKGLSELKFEKMVRSGKSFKIYSE